MTHLVSFSHDGEGSSAKRGDLGLALIVVTRKTNPGASKRFADRFFFCVAGAGAKRH